MKHIWVSTVGGGGRGGGHLLQLQAVTALGQEEASVGVKHDATRKREDTGSVLTDQMVDVAAH